MCEKVCHCGEFADLRILINGVASGPRHEDSGVQPLSSLCGSMPCRAPGVCSCAWAQLRPVGARGRKTSAVACTPERGDASALRGVRQGALAPLAASAALFGAYLLLKWLPDLNLQTLFDAYFWLVGALAVAGGIALPLRRTVRAGLWGLRHLSGGLRRARRCFTGYCF